jgi:hypothetical protein
MPIERMNNFFLDTDVVAAQADALYSFGRSYVFSKHINEVVNNMREPQKYFWLHTRFAHVNTAIIEWCHVLGNDCRSKIHWHNVAPRTGWDANGTRIENGMFKQTVRGVLRPNLSDSPA